MVSSVNEIGDDEKCDFFFDFWQQKVFASNQDINRIWNAFEDKKPPDLGGFCIILGKCLFHKLFTFQDSFHKFSLIF